MQWTYGYRFKEINSLFIIQLSYLVHSFVAETHCELYISFIHLLYFDSDDLQRQKGYPKM